MIIELGSGLGISTLYLASGSPDAPLHSIEGNTDRAAFAAQINLQAASWDQHRFTGGRWKRSWMI